MISGKTMMVWLEPESQRCTHDTVDKLFQSFADRMRGTTDGSCIDFESEDPKVLLQDLNGWTELYKIIRHEKINPDEWVDVISAKDGRLITLSKFELIPVYTDETREGFHGEQKYRYHLKNPAKIISTDRLRIKEASSLAGLETLIPIYVDKSGCEDTCGYNFVTRSHFYNANTFHLYGAEEIPVEAVVQWGWK